MGARHSLTIIAEIVLSRKRIIVKATHACFLRKYSTVPHCNIISYQLSRQLLCNVRERRLNTLFLIRCDSKALLTTT
jgi:hypothetical protein